MAGFAALLPYIPAVMSTIGTAGSLWAGGKQAGEMEEQKRLAQQERARIQGLQSQYATQVMPTYQRAAMGELPPSIALQQQAEKQAAMGQARRGMEELQRGLERRGQRLGMYAGPKPTVQEAPGYLGLTQQVERSKQEILAELANKIAAMNAQQQQQYQQWGMSGLERGYGFMSGQLPSVPSMAPAYEKAGASFSAALGRGLDLLFAPQQPTSNLRPASTLMGGG